MHVIEHAQFTGRVQGGTRTGIVTSVLALVAPALAIGTGAGTSVDSVIGTWLIAAAVGAFAAADAADRAEHRVGPRTRRAAAVVGLIIGGCALVLFWLSRTAVDRASAVADVSGAVLFVVEAVCVLALCVGLAAVRHSFLRTVLVTAAVALWVTVLTRAAVDYLASGWILGDQVDQVVRQASFLQTWLPLASGLGGLVAVLVGGRLAESSRRASGRLVVVAATPLLFALALFGLALLTTPGFLGGTAADLDVPSLLWLTAGCLAGLAVHGATTPA